MHLSHYKKMLSGLNDIYFYLDKGLTIYFRSEDRVRNISKNKTQ